MALRARVPKESTARAEAVAVAAARHPVERLPEGTPGTGRQAAAEHQAAELAAVLALQVPRVGGRGLAAVARLVGAELRVELVAAVLPAGQVQPAGP